VPVQFHLAERLVAQNAGVGAEQIDAAPLGDGAIHHGLDLFEIRDIGTVRHRDAAGLADFLDHGFGRGKRPAGTVALAAEIVDHDLGASARQPHRMPAS
jgi:hypothetical protein